MIIKLKEWRSRRPQRWAGGTKVRLCPVLRTVRLMVAGVWREGWRAGAPADHWADTEKTD